MNIKTYEEIKTFRQAEDSFSQKMVDSASLDLESIYPTLTLENLTNWYKQSPYTFIFTDSNAEIYKFNLPIAPSNLTITTHFATNVITTMYGTIEEHSQQRYFDINISGTTGMAPTYSTYKKIDKLSATESINKMSINPGRESFTVKSFLGSFNENADKIGFARRTTNLISNIENQVSDIIGDSAPPTGISTNSASTGYVAFHNFYKFLLKYKQDVANNTNATNRKVHPLTFVCWKDNTQYDVAINSFQLMRDANDPMLYKYSISLRGYNLNKAGATSQLTAESEADRLNSLGLSTSGFFGLNTSIKAFLARKARSVRNVAYATVAVVKSAGK
jgi:hypothetical protein